MKKVELFTSNPLVPNSKKYWCYRCKAHNSFDHIVNSNGTETHQKMSCVRCEASMFLPSQIIPWIVGTLGFSLIAVVIGLGLGGDGFLVSLGLAACSGLIGLSMLYYMILWSRWVRAQRAKPPEQLLREGKQYVSSSEGMQK
ncbi:hypothetical protein OAF15_03345 [Akkermansiaceae bacterium]|nr:hypothetical protein [Akkermansiaceae bacterium]MDB4749106.1 hypothetical protein [Akkermansiaceae bacterium]